MYWVSYFVCPIDQAPHSVENVKENEYTLVFDTEYLVKKLATFDEAKHYLINVMADVLDTTYTRLTPREFIRYMLAGTEIIDLTPEDFDEPVIANSIGPCSFAISTSDPATMLHEPMVSFKEI